MYSGHTHIPIYVCVCTLHTHYICVHTHYIYMYCVYIHPHIDGILCGNLLWKLAHIMIMEAEKSHDRLSANWRTREASDIAQSRSEGLRTRGVDRVSLSLST